eukprot:COSAG05_NODE_224_length_13609_cov_26.220429_16_plen_60_part_00
MLYTIQKHNTGPYLSGPRPVCRLERQGAEVRVRFQIIGNARIENLWKYQSCMVSKLPII